jgi:putative cell wall-binding protein
VTRIEGLPTYPGGTRYETAAESATTAYPDGAADVVLASGQKFPDALAGAGLAGQLDAPILLTPTAALPTATIAALEDLGAETVTILGGIEAVSAEVEAELVALGYDTDRVFGDDRFATAAAIAEQLGGDTAVLANGLRFPDALAISPGAHTLELPLVLTTQADLHPDAEAYLADPTVTDVIIVGGTEVVGQQIEDELEADGKTVTRLFGDTRYETAIEIAEFHLTVGFTLDELVMATGQKFADALTGGPLASQMGNPLVLTQTDTLTPATATFITENCEEIDALTIMGGVLAISQSVEDAAADAAQCGVTTNQSFTVTPGERAVNTVSDTATGAAPNRGARQYSVTVTGTDPVDIALFDCADVMIDENGVVTFVPNSTTATGTNRWAQRTQTDAAITVVNGVATGQTVETAPADSGYVNNVTPTNGTVTFTINSDSMGCVVPVVFRDNQPTAAGDNNLQLGANNQPTEDFGVGGEKQWIPRDAAAGAFGPDDVEFVDTALNLFVADGVTFRYEDGDIFQIRIGGVCVATSLANFEANLSVDDSIEGVYAPGPNTQSTFCLEDLAPSAPQNVTAASVSPTSVRVDWDASALGDIDQYNVFRFLFHAPATTETTNCPDPNATTGNTYTQVASVPGSTTEYTDTGLTTGTRYCYAVSAVDGQEETARVAATPLTGVRPAADATQPVSNNIQLITDAGFTGIMDGGDVFRVGFNEQMAAPDAGDTIRVRDTDATTPTVADVICGTNATCTLNAEATTVDGVTYQPGTVITVTMTGSPTIVTAGTVAGVQYPADVINSSGVTDTSGNSWNVAGSPDVRIASGTTVTPAA